MYQSFKTNLYIYITVKIYKTWRLFIYKIKRALPQNLTTNSPTIFWHENKGHRWRCNVWNIKTYTLGLTHQHLKSIRHVKFHLNCVGNMEVVSSKTWAYYTDCKPTAKWWTDQHTSIDPLNLYLQWYNNIAHKCRRHSFFCVNLEISLRNNRRLHGSEHGIVGSLISSGQFTIFSENIEYDCYDETNSLRSHGLQFTARKTCITG